MKPTPTALYSLYTYLVLSMTGETNTTDTDSAEVRFRHIMPGDRDKVELPDNVQFQHVSMEVGPQGQAHLMWFQKGSSSISPTDI